MILLFLFSTFKYCIFTIQRLTYISESVVAVSKKLEAPQTYRLKKKKKKKTGR